METHEPALLTVAVQQIDELVEILSVVEGVFYSPFANDEATNTGWIRLLTEWKEAIEKAPTTPLPQAPKLPTPVTLIWGRVTEKLLLLACGVIGAAPIVAIIALVYWLVGRLQPR